MADTTIEWTDVVWNPTTGCDKVSPGCDNCYALTMAKRLKGMGSAKYQQDGDPRTSGPGFLAVEHADALTAPLHWTKPRKVFVNSMSDLFHDNISREFIAQVWAVMAATPQHTYQVLTKRHARMRSVLRDECRCGSGHAPGVHLRSKMEWAATPHSPTYVPGLKSGLYHRMTWPLPNVWVGVSTEDQQWADIRIPALLDTPAAVRWISAEPLLGPIDLYGQVDPILGGRRKLTHWLTGAPTWGQPEPIPGSTVLGSPLDVGPKLDWVVAGGESGKDARPAHHDWFRTLRDQCTASGVPFLFKQWGEWAPESHCATERGAKSALYIERDGSTRTAAWGARAGAVTIQRNGKHATGRRLDGRTWDEYPAGAA